MMVPAMMKLGGKSLIPREIFDLGNLRGQNFGFYGIYPRERTGYLKSRGEFAGKPK